MREEGEREEHPDRFTAPVRTEGLSVRYAQPLILHIEYLHTSNAMLRNYLRIALRNLQRETTFAVINVAGLALGIACCVILALFVRHEWRYDRFHEDADRIVRINKSAMQSGGERVTISTTPFRLAPGVEASLPQIERTVRVSGNDVRFEGEGREPLTAEALYADSTFFDLFSFDAVHGSASEALRGPDRAILAEAMAQRWFGRTDVVGETVTLRHEEEVADVTISAVVADPPEHSTLQFDALLPLEAMKRDYVPVMRQVFDRWDVPTVMTFAALQPGTDRRALAEEVTAWVAERSGEDRSSGFEVMGSENATGPAFSLQPLLDVHANPDISNGSLEPATDPLYAYLVGAGALLVLLIAGVNFTTLALGRTARRSREVGVRKALGASRNQVRRQFWGEAMLTSAIALVLGVAAAGLFLPVFNKMTQQSIAFDITPSLVVGLLVLTVLVGILAGSYPALVLSQFQPASVLRSGARITGGNALVRGLVVVQFTLSIALIAGTIVMNRQIAFMENNHGFQADQVVEITMRSTVSGADVYEQFRPEALQLAGVESVGATGFSFFGGSGIPLPISLGDTATVAPKILPSDADFTKTLGVEVVDGRPLDPERDTGGRSVLINESFARALGWPDPVGKTIDFSTSESDFGRVFGTVEVVGVVEDVHTASLRQRIEPLVIAADVFGGGVSAFYVRLRGETAGATYDQLRQIWAEVAPTRTFDARWLDEVVAEAYADERRVQSIVRSAAGFALFIACVGLFGIAALVVRRREKEVGIRKVLGASVGSIASLFTRDVALLAGLAFLLGAPIAYVSSSRWLQTFAYHIDVGVGPLLGAGLLVGAIAVGTVAAQVARAARLDPVQTIRDE